jgi:putative transposase
MRQQRVRDVIALEARRKQAARMLRAGVAQAEVARRCGVSRQSISRWAAALAQAGPSGLRRAGYLGRKARLRPQQLRQLAALVSEGAVAAGFATDGWTGPRIAKLIADQFGVVYRRTRALDLLRQLRRSARR